MQEPRIYALSLQIRGFTLGHSYPVVTRGDLYLAAPGSGESECERRRLKASRPTRIYLDRAEQITALLDAAGRIDAESRADQERRLHRRALLATLTFAGLRISEALDLEWRDVDLAAGRLRVRSSKTDAGVRYVELLPVLRDELAALKADRDDAVPYVFPSAAGTRQDRNRVRNRVLARAIKAAKEQLANALRRTFASVLVALGRDPA